MRLIAASSVCTGLVEVRGLGVEEVLALARAW
jgi:hypothetical protein